MIKVVQGDITQQEVDIIVNAANSHLAPGGGVCGAIYKVGGQSIFDECEQIVDRTRTLFAGECIATKAGNLKANFVIHAVGPIWVDGNYGEGYELKEAYRNSLNLAMTLGAKTIAFPSISTGIYKFPVSLASEIAIEQANIFQDCFDEIRFVLFDDTTFTVFDNQLNHLYI